VVLGDSLLRDLPVQFAAWPGIDVRCYRGAKLGTLIELFTTGFVASDWEKVHKLLLLVGTNEIEKTSLKEFEKKYKALIQIIRARLGNIDFIVWT
jgi:hypothetical protein